MKKFFNNYFLYFWSQGGWFLCVFAAQKKMDFYSLFVPVIAWLVFAKVHKPTPELKSFLIRAALIGCLFDYLMIRTGVIFNSDSNLRLPLWLISMWFLFVTILPRLKNLFQGRIWLAGIVAAMAGPLTYYSGQNLGVLVIPDLVTFIGLYACFWSVFFVVLLKRLNLAGSRVW